MRNSPNMYASQNYTPSEYVRMFDLKDNESGLNYSVKTPFVTGLYKPI